MAKLALSRDFLPEYARLEKSIQKKVDDAIGKFEHHTHAGLNLEKLGGTKDPRVRTIRIDQGYRGIVMAPDAGDTYVLVHVLKHSESDKWVTRNVFSVNQATGALEVQDIVALQGATETLSAVDTVVPLFATQRVKDFTRLGIPEQLVPMLQKLETESELDGLCLLLPPGQADALKMLAAGYSVDEAWGELLAGSEDPGVVDVTDVDAALERQSSSSMWYVVQGGADEVVDMLNRPFALWRTFLHPKQRQLAYRDTYRGPAQVTGGAGTGKTVVALHRAGHLASQFGSTPRAQKPILFTTFTRNLARSIEANLELLAGPEILATIDVVNVDRVAADVVRRAEGHHAKRIEESDEAALWEDVIAELGLSLDPRFLDAEWRQVILAQAVTTREDYFGAARAGRGVALTRLQRADVWKAQEVFLDRLTEMSVRTHLQVANDAARLLAEQAVKPYRHVIVDEAQDLHPAQWRMLRAIVAEGPNDLFVVGDSHQRIYDTRVSLSKLGINVRGRSHRLRLNYRTTHEILVWTLGLLTGETFDDLDDGADSLIGYRSELHGPSPTVTGYASLNDEIDGLVEAIRQWVDDGVAPEDIAVAARTGELFADVATALENVGIASTVLGGSADTETDAPGVALSTMHRMKGLEFRCVALLDAGRGRLPLEWTLTPAGMDDLERKREIQRERSLAYVACTRARDSLRVSWHGDPSEFIEPLLAARED